MSSARVLTAFTCDDLGSSHNNLRISRILKCLSELGLEHLNAGFLLHVLNEQSQHNDLNSTGIRSSMDRWWANCIRKEQERLWIRDIIHKVRAKEGEFVFTRGMYEEFLQTRARTGRLGFDDRQQAADQGTENEVTHTA